MTETNFSARPVRRGEEEELYRQVKRSAKRRWRDARGLQWFLMIMLSIAMAANFALASGVRILFPLVRTDHVFFGVHEDGSVDTALTERDLTETERESMIKAQAFTYIHLCEGYIWGDAQRNFDDCRNMSDRPVAEAFVARWFLPNNKPAPTNPDKLYGPKGQIDIGWISDPVLSGDHVVYVRYTRTAWHQDEGPKPVPGTCNPLICKTWTAALDYMLLDKLPSGHHHNNAIKMWVTRVQLSEGAG